MDYKVFIIRNDIMAMGFNSRRASPTEVFKLVLAAARLEFRSRMHERWHAHSPKYHGSQTENKTVDAQWQLPLKSQVQLKRGILTDQGSLKGLIKQVVV